MQEQHGRQKNTWKVAAAPFEDRLAIQWATSSMFGTVADTATKRTAEPRVFIRDTTTSRVLPRDSLSIWTCIWSISSGRIPLELLYFVDKEEPYLREELVVARPPAGSIIKNLD
jgi:hypothetical protein